MLAAGQSIELVDTGAPNLTVKLTAPAGEALNLGTLSAASGRIGVHAALVNQQGIVRADSLSAGPGGEIVLQAGKRLNLAARSVTSASSATGDGGRVKLLGREVGLFGSALVEASGGGAGNGGEVMVGGGQQGKDTSVPNAQAVYFGRDALIRADAGTVGNGGRIILWSDAATRVFGSLSAQGGVLGGDGGFIETSGNWLDARPLAVNVSAVRGRPGQWLLDPYAIYISDGAIDNAYDSSFTSTGDFARINAATLSAALNAGTNVTVTTGAGSGSIDADITVQNAHILVTAAAPGSLTLSAYYGISISNSVISSSGGALPVSLLSSNGGSYGGVGINNSTINTAGGRVLIGGFGTGVNPDGTVFANATRGSLLSSPGLRVTQGAVIDAGSGNIEINASNFADGLVIDGASRLRGANIMLRGYSQDGDGVRFGTATLTATHSLTVQGRGAAQGVSIPDGAQLEVVPTVTDPTAALTVTGRSDRGGYGVSITSNSATGKRLVVSKGATMTVSGDNDPGIRAAVFINGAYYYLAEPLLNSGIDGGLVTVRVVGNGNSIRIKDAGIGTVSAGLNIVAGGELYLRNAPITIGGKVDMRASRITLDSGTVVNSSWNGGGDAIVLRGVTGGLDFFINYSGAGSLIASSPGERWIVNSKNSFDYESFLAAGLAYDFKRYGGASSTAWAADVGNGFVSSAGMSASFSATAANKVYDGTVAASLSNASARGNFNNSDIGSLSSLSLPAFDSKNVGSAKSITFQSAEPFNFLDASGKPVYGNTLIGNLAATITPAPLSGLVTAANKVYDATRSATVNVNNVSGLVPGETVIVRATGQFADKNVGNGKTVTAAYQLSNGASGDLASNYSFIPPSASPTASITPLALTATGLSAGNKVYDATTLATLSGTAAVTALAGDQLSLSGAITGSFVDKKVGVAKAVAVQGLILAGVDASNYVLAVPILLADITPAALSITGVAANNKVYDSSTTAGLTGTASLAAVLGNDQVNLTGSGVASFADKNVGTAKPVTVNGYGLGGADAANYQLAEPTGLGANILPATLTYTADIAVRTAGGTFGTFTGSVSGFVGTDTLPTTTTGTASYTTLADGSSRAGLYTINGSGLKAQNYILTQAVGNARALELTVLPPELPQNGGSDVAVTTALVTLSAVRVSIEPSAGGLADLTATSRIASSAGPADFGSVSLASMSPQALQNMLDARDLYKKTLFAESITRLEQDPGLADLKPCTSKQNASLGTCLVTETLKAKFQDGSGAVSTQASNTAAPVAPVAVAAAAPADADAAATADADAAVAAASAVPSSWITAKRKVRSAALPAIERKVALVIGVDNYADASIPKLGNAVRDAEAIGQVFETGLGYETVVLANARKADVVSALNALALELNARDSVMIYYAGHGALIEATQLGYWQLADSDAKKPESWLSNADISRMVSRISASQVALISDSCYSGSLVNEAKIRATPGMIDPVELLLRKSVVVMSSGGNEPVFDNGKQGHSPFAWNLMNTLQKVSSWQAGGQVFERVRFAVARELPQRPQYGASSVAGHQQGGDYLFEQRQLEARN
ncbi:MAG: caspase family protein [Bdellovibrionales bacterium]|nr:caspase family protein [Massilia sp.]